MKKPKEAIEWLRVYRTCPADRDAIIAYLDSIPDDAHVCEWPKGLTRERLEELSNQFGPSGQVRDALRALAAIAPEAPKKRMAEIWETGGGTLTVLVLPINADKPTSWRKVGGPVEIDE